MKERLQVAGRDCANIPDVLICYLCHKTLQQRAAQPQALQVWMNDEIMYCGYLQREIHTQEAAEAAAGRSACCCPAVLQHAWLMHATEEAANEQLLCS